MAVDWGFMYAWVLIPLGIFFARILDVSLGTLRIIFVSKGIIKLAPIIGFFEVLIFVLAISQVLQNDLSVWNVVAYCAGFAAGNIAGAALEEQIALGFSSVRVITRHSGTELSAALRRADFGVTQMFGLGREGIVDVVETAVRRRDVPCVHRIATQLDENAFVMVDQNRSVFQGHLRQGK